MTALNAPIPFAVAGALLGLLIGSFLNVVIYRLPTWLQHQWQLEATDLLGLENTQPAPPDLAFPASHCPKCGHPLRWWHNIPVFSFALLMGRCHFCHTPISWRYPTVEVLCSVWFAWCAHRYGSDWIQAIWWAGWGAALLCAALIDWRTFLLPDAITQPLLWGGLIAANLGWIPVSPGDAVWGAALGYGLLAGPAWGFERLTGKVGMAPGDFKLLAAVGAALGWQSVIPLLLLACGVGIALALLTRFMHRLPQQHAGLEAGAIPFGPAIAAAAAITQIWPHWTLALQF